MCEAETAFVLMFIWHLASVQHITSGYRSSCSSQIYIHCLSCQPNSIVHWFSCPTDLPSVVSGNQIGFFDPHQKHFSRGETGRRFSFDVARDPKYSDQFSSYNVLGCNLSKSKYDGTLFRFPLRQRPSPNLCSTVCTPDRIRELFRSFQSDAHLVLLFLKTIEVISVYEWLPGKLQPFEVFSVGLSGRTRLTARQERKDLLREVATATSEDGSLRSGCTVSRFYQAEVTCTSQGTTSISQTWLVENYISTVNAEVCAIGGKLAQIPWVGLAVPIGRKTKHAEGLGRIFCFLPLPPSADADSNAGLPVHVHGSFSVADNRRSLKWPADDRVRDEKAVWNRLLAEQLLTQAYAELIQHATHLSTDVVSVQDVYDMWPDMQHVQYQWARYVIPLFLSSLAQLAVLYGIGASESSWKRVKGVLISNTTQQFLSLDESVAIEELKRMGYSIAFPAANVTSCLNEIARQHGVSADKVSPGVVRDALKQNSYYQNMKRHNKIQLLKYVLQDHNYSGLAGLSLLPLADGAFTAFSSSLWAKEVYIESVECPRSLFPGLNAMFLDETIDAGVYKTLRKAVVSGGTQLKIIQPTHVPSLISQVLSSAQLSSRTYTVSKPQTVHGQSTGSWIRDLWVWINQHVHRVALDKFQNLYIIPVTSSRGEQKLMKLATNLPAIYAKLPRVAIQINKELASGLESLGCTVLFDPPDFLTSCSQLHIWGTYICQPSGILACISRAAGSSSKYHLLSQVQRRELASVVSAAVHVCHPSTSEQNVIYQLPLFREWGGDSLTSISSCCQVAPVELPESLPVRASLIASPTLETQQILKWIPAGYYCQLSVDEVYTKIVFQQFQKCSATDKEKLVFFALDNFHLLASSTRQRMASLQFVPTGNGQMKAPNELFNPNEQYVSELFGDRFVFPCGAFAIGKKYGELLFQYVGLRRLQDITANELLQLVSCVAANRKRVVGQTLLKVLTDQPWAQLLLQNKVYWGRGWMLGREALATMSWMPVIERCPQGYPVGMPWKGSSATYLPACVAVASDQFTLDKLQLLVGSQLAILDHEQPLSLELIKLLSCATFLHVYQEATKQLIEAHKQWTSKPVEKNNREKYDRMLQELFRTIGFGYCNLVSAAEVVNSCLRSPSAPNYWVWLDGSRGFTQPQQLAVSSAFPVSLEPWLFTIEHYPHLAQCTELLQSHGMKAKFEEEDVLSVLASMKAKYDVDALSLGKTDRERDLELTLAVLNWVTRDQTILSESLQNTLLVPVDREDNKLELAPCSELMYCDADWLRRGHDTELDEYRLVHRQISPETAHKLGVPSLSNRMAPSEELPFEQLGPHESLTLRIANILKEYKDDAGVFKELLQNADDAEATEVKFLIDWREHDKSSLLSPGMSKCQGPALWAYNNSVFRDEDFTNIARLAAGTKQSQLEKIGRFGLGFTSVYHITDVPSFVSRQFVVMFDPHKSHLGNHIRNPSQPGIKVDFVKRPIGRRFPDQFRPYTGVFGCNLEEGSEFEGTLFRFPLRTREQAAVSEIKSEPYDKDRVKGSFQTLKSVCGKLLIFLHHVTSIQVFELGCEASSPAEMKRILSCQSKTTPVGDTVTHLELLMSSCRQVERGGSQCLSGSASIREITWCGTETELAGEEKWFICSEAGKGSALHFSCTHGGKSLGLVPFAGLAVGLQENSLHPRPLEGETFCFLPLSARTGLPFHVNALFAVLSNRRGIWWHGTRETSVSGKSDVDAEWNKELITDCLTQACMSMLKQLSALITCTESGVASYYSLWPKLTELLNPAWHTLTTRFYATIVNSGERVFFTSTGMPLKSISLSDCVFLLESVSKALPRAKQIMKEFCSNYIQLPEHVLDGLRNASGAVLKELTVDEEQFIVNWFAPHVAQVNPKVRDELLLAILTQTLTVPHRFQSLRHLCLIPCSPDGMIFRPPSELIDPKCEEADLFLEDERKFPLKGVYQRDEVVLALKKLGMRSTGCFTWEDVVERSRTVEPLDKKNHPEAGRRARAVIKLMNSLCERKEVCSLQHKDSLKQTPFLLVERRPVNYPVQWYADQHPDQRVVAVANCYTSHSKLIVGSQAFIVDNSLKLTNDTASFLGLSSAPPLSMVIDQLDLAINALQRPAALSEVMPMIKKLYKELQSRYYSNPQSVVESLTDKAWIVIDGHVMKPYQLACDWGKKAPPYLSGVPTDLSYIKDLLEATGVQKSFEHADFVRALKQISSESNGERLSKSLLYYVTQLIIPEFSRLGKSELEQFRGESEVPLLSTDEYLLPASELAYNDAPWMGGMEKYIYVHRTVPRAVAEGLGVKLVREKMLDRYARDIPGKEFGQSEPLTQRLQSILEQYPAGEEILKELLQNADDAGATELHLIFDQRKYKTKRVFSDEWKSLQGPAICVYNNRPFTDSDIAGIQNLGRGGKRDDPSSIGQYGIGFNAVYHLTDCPSFLSDNKTLCVLDPHCHYVPGAHTEKPGRLFVTDTMFWNEFSDIRECSKTFDGIMLDGGTLFRFPLRTAEMKSSISKEVFDSGRVLQLFALFKRSASDMLLFLNNVNAIKLSVVDQVARVIDSYEVTASVSPMARDERLKVAQFVAESKGKPTASIMYNSTFYVLDVSEKSSESHRKIMEGKWLVHQSIGIPHPDTSTSFTDGCSMALLPRVGIAAPIMQNLDRKETTLSCFLPLPVKWNLPVQVNGHFALHSNRRGLWEDSSQSHASSKHKWNEDLIRFVLAPAYATFLLEARQYVDTNEDTSSRGRRSRVETKLDWFHRLLPKYLKSETVYLPILLKELYGYIVQHSLPLLASTGRPSQPLGARRGTFTEDEKKRLDMIFPGTTSRTEAAHSLQWLEVGKRSPLGLLTAYFWRCDLARPDVYILEELLFRLGYPLVSSPLPLLVSIKEVNDSADVECVSPQSVFLFLKAYEGGSSCCLNLGKVEDTVFLTVRAVNLMLQYVLPANTPQSGVSQLSGIPLLVTDDGQLREFSTSPATFRSIYSKLLPRRRDLFVHRDLITTLLLSEDPVLKKLGPSDVIHHLPEQGVFPTNWLVADRYFEDWDPTVGPSKEWIESLWSFLNGEDLNTALDCLKDLPVIPATGGKILIPPSLSYTVFTQLSSPSSLFEGMCKVLINLEAVEMDRCIRTGHSYPHVGGNVSRSELVYKRFATLEKPLSVVRALLYLYTNRCPKTTSTTDAETLLKYFQDCGSSMNSSFLSEIKKLPLFETVGGTLTNLPPFHDSYTLPPDLPPAGSAVWMAEAKCTFLKQKHKFNELYEKLSLNNKTTDEVYVDYVLPCFPKMSQADRMAHLVSLMKGFRLLETESALVQALKDTACFDRQGKLKKISELYDPRIRLFCLMLPEKAFPPTPVLAKCYENDWLPFLRNLGLKNVCSTRAFLAFGNRIAEETSTWQPAGQEPADFEQWKVKSKEMVAHLTEKLEDHWSDCNFMRDMSKIRFLPSQRVGEELQRLATPYYKHGPATRYATSYCEGVYHSNENERLCWTSQVLLSPHGSMTRSRSQAFRDAVGLQMQPNLDSVLDHFNRLVEGAKQFIKPNRDIESKTVRHLTEVLAVIFCHLSKYVADKPRKELSPFADLRNSKVLSDGLSHDGVRIVSFLISSPCVFLPDKQMFVKPHQVVFSLEDEFYPYFLQLPYDFAQHHLLLKRMGVDEKPRPFHCARVLEALKEKYGDKPVSSPNDLKVLMSVVRLLFGTLKHHSKPLAPVRSKIEFLDQEIEEALQPLYLPSQDRVLKLSSELVFLDRLHLEGHVGNLQYKFLMDLMDCGLSSLEEETVNLLPVSLRPHKVSDLTEELLDPECRPAVGDDQLKDKHEQDDVAAVYQERYSSHLFVQGVRSIYIHQTRSRDIPAELENGLCLLQNCFHVVCVPEIRTCLRLRESGQIIKLGDISKCCFLERSELEATLYLEKSSATKAQMSGGNIKLFGLIAQELQVLLHSQLPEFPMIMIVSCPPEIMPTALKALNIPFVHDGEDPQSTPGKFVCQPGMDLLPDHVALLRQSPRGYRFNIDEWVAYETSENRFIYAVILYREISEDGTTSELLTRYGIDVGEEKPEVVGVLSLYAFVVDGEKEPDQPERSLVVSDSGGAGGGAAAASTSGPETLDEKKEAVRKQLREIWQLPDRERKTAIRRLYLQWHPDKSDDSDAEEVFKFIKNEIERLERGGDNFSGSYSSYYDRWSSFARSCGRRRRHRTSSSSSYSYQAPPSFCFSRSEPQPEPERSKGSMFVEQAKADLSAAEWLFQGGNSDSGLYAAVCFHCHEVVEKALKGLLFIHRGIPYDRRRKHYIGFFLGATDLPGCPASLKEHASEISDSYYLDTRYPDQRNVVPATVYDREEARQALSAAQGVMKDTLTFLS